MHDWQLDYIRGRRWLRRHRPVVALRYFERAIENAPFTRRVPSPAAPSNRTTLASLFAYFAIALQKAGMPNRAHGSRIEATRLVKRGAHRRIVVRRSNEYGMARQPTTVSDDKHAFYGAQLAHYVRSKKSHRLGTRAEIDMVAELIDDAWCELRDTIDLPRLTADQKLKLFENTLVVFPFLSVPETMKTHDVAVDFGNGTRLEPGDRCTCGSGLLFRLCHGRTPGADEALIGRF